MRCNPGSRRWLPLVLAVVLLGPAPGALASVGYDITPITGGGYTDPIGRAMNDQMDVIGDGISSDGVCGFQWQNGTITQLPGGDVDPSVYTGTNCDGVTGDDGGNPFGINDSDLIAGLTDFPYSNQYTSGQAQQATSWQGAASPTDLGTGCTSTSYPDTSAAYAVNASGTVAGYYTVEGSGCSASISVDAWVGSPSNVIGTGESVALNDNGTVVIRTARARSSTQAGRLRPSTSSRRSGFPVPGRTRRPYCWQACPMRSTTPVSSLAPRRVRRPSPRTATLPSICRRPTAIPMGSPRRSTQVARSLASPGWPRARTASATPSRRSGRRRRRRRRPRASRRDRSEHADPGGQRDRPAGRGRDQQRRRHPRLGDRRRHRHGRIGDPDAGRGLGDGCRLGTRADELGVPDADDVHRLVAGGGGVGYDRRLQDDRRHGHHGCQSVHGPGERLGDNSGEPDQRSDPSRDRRRQRDRYGAERDLPSAADERYSGRRAARDQRRGGVGDRDDHLSRNPRDDHRQGWQPAGRGGGDADGQRRFRGNRSSGR